MSLAYVLFALPFMKLLLKDKSGVGVIVDYSRDYIVVDVVQYFFQFFSPLISETTYFNLLRSAK